MGYRDIQFTKSFTKDFKKLPAPLQTQFYTRLTLFKADPNAKSLRDHALKGKFVGYRSINITGDVRALYYVQQDVVVIFAFIGTHSKLYG